MAIKVGTKARTMRKITMMVLVTLKKGNVKKLRFGREKDKFENQLALIKNRESYVCDRSKGNLDVTRWTSDWQEASALLYTQLRPMWRPLIGHTVLS